jgi:hypothetical protein
VARHPAASKPETKRQGLRILAVSDAVSPFVYSANFPDNLPAFDLILAAGDMPGYVLEFLATKSTHRPVYVLGNHANGYVRDPDSGETRLPGGCINAHRRVIEHEGLLIAGFEGSPRYRPGEHQYREWEYARFAWEMMPALRWNELRKGRAVDILLTHAAPLGPHAGDDWPHRGVPAFNRFHQRWKPKLHVHGHVHLNGANAPRRYVTDEGVTVVNAFEFTLIDWPPLVEATQATSLET